MAKKRRRNQHLIIRVSVAEKAALNQAAAAQDVPASQLVRKAIKTAMSETEALTDGKPAA